MLRTRFLCLLLPTYSQGVIWLFDASSDTSVADTHAQAVKPPKQKHPRPCSPESRNLHVTPIITCSTTKSAGSHDQCKLHHHGWRRLRCKHAVKEYSGVSMYDQHPQIPVEKVAPYLCAALRVNHYQRLPCTMLLPAAASVITIPHQLIDALAEGFSEPISTGRLHVVAVGALQPVRSVPPGAQITAAQISDKICSITLPSCQPEEKGKLVLLDCNVSSTRHSWTGVCAHLQCEEHQHLGASHTFAS